jgi:hypothetical protein
MTCSGDAFWTSKGKKKLLKVDCEGMEEGLNHSDGFGDWNKVFPIEE